MSLTIDQLNEIMWSFRQVRVLFTALELDVFAHLGEGASATGLAKKLSADPRATEMLLNALVNLEILTKSNDRFFNTEISAQQLTGDNRMAAMHQVYLWKRWSSLTEAVRRGHSALPREVDEQDTEAFIAAMHRNATERAIHVIAAVDATKSRRMIDLGGGSGAYSIAFCEANPELQATIFDRPQVLKIAQRHIAEAGLQNRVITKTGDLTTDSFGEGFDLVLLSQILHSFSPEENTDVLRRAYAALVPGGRIVIQEFLLDPEKTSPRWPVFFSINMLVGTQGGAAYTEEEVGTWLTAVGFKGAKHVPLPPSTGLLIARK